MLSLPSLAPQDSYTLWYSSSSSDPSHHAENNSSTNDHTNPPQGQNAATQHANRRAHALHRTPLARLRLDEEYLERRKKNIQNYGNSWIKPPGVPKSLHQLREEKREMEEHQEALRREALAQELAEAEAADEVLQQQRRESEIGEVRDLDDDVPEADTTALVSEDSDEDSDAENEDILREDGEMGVPQARNPALQRTLMMADRQAREMVREIAGFDDEGASELNEVDQSQMLQEEDLVHDLPLEDADENMQDLDDEIPEAGGYESYEHTDTEEEISSSEDEDESMDRLPRGHPATTSMIRSDGTQASMDFSGIISNPSSQMGSSPQRSGRGRRGGYMGGSLH